MSATAANPGLFIDARPVGCGACKTSARALATHRIPNTPAMNPNDYAHWAEFYDLDPRNLYIDDIAFYRDHAGRAGGEVLELGCGTGRVALPLARDGFRVTGLDHSPAMLRSFRRKLEREDAACRSRMTLVQGDMAQFELGRTFSLITIPFRSFQALVDPALRESCLACVKRHLDPGGTFIVDVFRPRGVLDHSWVQPEEKDWSTRDPDGRRITRYATQRAIDPDAQVIEVDFRFVVEEPSGAVSEVTDRLRLAYYYEGQIAALVERCGFRIKERLGHYDGTPIDRGSELILVGEPRESGEV